MTNLRILIIDDDPLQLNTLESILFADGHLPTVASGGQSGLDLFQTSLANGSPFDVVITDLSMPYIDGSMVAAKIRELSPDTPIILLTGWHQMQIQLKVPLLVDRVLNKPLRLSELREVLLAVVATHGN